MRLLYNLHTCQLKNLPTEKKIAVQLNRLGLFLYFLVSMFNKQSFTCLTTKGRGEGECVRFKRKDMHPSVKGQNAFSSDLLLFFHLFSVLCNCRVYFVSEKCDFADEIQSQASSTVSQHWVTLQTELKEITVSRGY